ncbi:MAG: glycerol-3-phosphate 1-O-acyltransferase PlsY [Clostridia bacterium]|nr:glycerol-3-phosphate 1-O-acyltransferase PlsY [Clostridia bacterium]
MNIFSVGLIAGLINEVNKSYEFYLITLGLAVLSVAVSYLLGSLSSAIIVSKMLYKEDIRTHGSGNAGLTNMLRTYGKGAAALTLVGDMGKTAIAILFTALIFGFSYKNGVSMSGVLYLSGLSAVLGHVFPIFYGFKGGKGVLVTATMALILTPAIFVILLTVFIIVVALSGFVSLGSIIVAALFPISVCLYSYIFGGSIPVLTIICTVFLGAFVIWCHRTNIERLKSGTEKKISIGKK